MSYKDENLIDVFWLGCQIVVKWLSTILKFIEIIGGEGVLTNGIIALLELK
jgi:hypothetical protein